MVICGIATHCRDDHPTTVLSIFKCYFSSNSFSTTFPSAVDLDLKLKVTLINTNIYKYDQNRIQRSQLSVPFLFVEHFAQSEEPTEN